MESVQQSRGRIGQKDIIAEKNNSNRRREEKNAMMEKVMNQLRLREDQKRSVTQIKMIHGKPRSVLIPQVRPAHKYPNSPWEMIHPPGGDNAVRM
jgi:hypothetical protein